MSSTGPSGKTETADCGGGAVKAEPAHRPKKDFDGVFVPVVATDLRLGLDDWRETAGDAAGVL